MSTKAIFAKAHEEHEAFLRELGRLTLAWADIETVLFKLLKHYSGVSWPVAQALFSGTRARNAMNFIQAIADNTQMEILRKRDLEEIFARISSINSLRDFVVHHVNGSEQIFDDADPGKRYVSDSLRASRKAKAKTYLVGSSTLSAMTADCEECCWRLHAHWNLQNQPFEAGSGRGERQQWKFLPPSPTQHPTPGW